VLEFGVGFDPNIGFDTLTFADCPTGDITPTFTATPTVSPPSACQTTVADFSAFQAGQSVEGMGAVIPGLQIDAKGTAVKIATSSKPLVFIAPNGSGIINGGLVAGGGFSDNATRLAKQAHQYTFTFAPGTSVNNFSLRMLDYGDYNEPLDTARHVSMTAYNAANEVITVQELNFTTSAEKNPRTSDVYGDPWESGDAVDASSGQPGNWTWNVSGDGIVRVELEFGAGFDPNISFDTLTFADCP
jgi:hypothetical protein